MIYTGLHRHLYTQNALKEKHGEHTCVCAFTHTHIHTQKERIYNSAEEMADEGHSNLKPRANIHSEPRCGEREMAFSKDSSPTSQGYLLSSLDFLETGSHVLKLSMWLRMTLSFCPPSVSLEC